MNKLSERLQQILQATVHHYLDTIEPVSSRTLVQRFGIPASSATVRSAMGSLEKRGYLTQPHTSSGRVPSPKGYRHYVDCLLPAPGIAVQHLERELTTLSLGLTAMDDILHQIAKRLTDFTGLMSLITRPAPYRAKLEAIRLVKRGERLLVMLVEDSGRARHLNLPLPIGADNELTAIESWADRQLDNGSLNWSSLPPQLQRSGDVLKTALAKIKSGKFEQPVLVHGLSRLMAQPEFQSGQTVQPLLQLIDEQPVSLVSDALQATVWIGKEHPQSALQRCSVVQAPYHSADGIGQVALVGPMRMAYATARAAVLGVARHLELMLS